MTEMSGVAGWREETIRGANARVLVREFGGKEFETYFEEGFSG